MQMLEAVLGNLLGSLINLNGSGHYVHWGFIQISVANLVLIGLMVVVFVAAILIPFRRHGGGDQ
jgi:membrane protein YqaA with SNARE-associated domain